MPGPTEFDDSNLKGAISALAAEAPMTPEELERVRLHFENLARLMLVSGTIFASARHEAMRLHNRALARINGAPANPVRQRERAEEEARRLPIDP